MKKLFSIFVFFGILAFIFLQAVPARAQSEIARRFSGRILIQVESKGEAWYVNPVNYRRYYLGRPEDAFNIMRSLGLGITNANLARIPTYDNNKWAADKNIISKVRGRILIQVQAHGEAWYVSPNNNRRYYMGRPANAFQLMRNLGLGVTNQNLSQIEIGAGAFVSSWSFVDGNTASGINKDSTKSVDHPQLTVFNEKLYAIWSESYNNINQIRVAVYNGSNTTPAWSFVDGNTAYGINKDKTKAADKPQLTVFKEKLYAIWKENNGTADQIRVAVYNNNDTSFRWTFVDGNTANGINKDHFKSADAPQITVFKERLYAVWKEDNGTATQVRVAVYNGNDTNSGWSFVDGNTAKGINKDNTKSVYAPQLTVFNTKLYVIWKENNGTADQVRVAVYSGDDVSPSWIFVDGNIVNGINKDSTKNAYYPQLTVFNAKLYAIWRENNGTAADQVRVAVYNSNDTSPTWTFVDGNTAKGINKDKTKFADTPQLTVFNTKLYATWVEKNNTAEQTRVAVYGGNDASPAWAFIDGNTVSGINKDNTKASDSPQLTVFKAKLYATWSENNGRAWQVRVAVGQ